MQAVTDVSSSVSETKSMKGAPKSIAAQGQIHQSKVLKLRCNNVEFLYLVLVFEITFLAASHHPCQQ